MSNRNNIREGIFNTFNETPSQQQFVRNNSSFQPNSTFYNTSNNISSRGQNINSWEHHNLKSNFSQNILNFSLSVCFLICPLGLFLS